MESKEDERRLIYEKVVKKFSDFMTRIAKFEELSTMGSRSLVGFRQALGFIARPPIDKTSALIEGIIEAHGTSRLLSYVEAGGFNSDDSVKYVSQLQTCHLGLQENMNKAKSVIDELKLLLDDVVPMVQLAKEQDEDLKCEEEMSSNLSTPEVVDYAALMAIIFSMIKQDYEMQDRIVSSLNLKSSPGELDTYCQMWSLRPYIDDDIMHKAWKLIP